MEWTDEGILLASRRHGEASAVASLLTHAHGRHGGLVRGGAGKALRGVLQPGNRLAVTWKARLPEHLGHFTCELASALGTAWLHDPLRLAAIASACAVAEATLPEREPHGAAYEGLAGLLTSMEEPEWPALYVRWELGLLGELGFGLDLARCAVTGATDGLAYVSPRSGRAVSRTTGQAYRDRLLALPGFLVGEGRSSAPGEVMAGLALTAYFLERHVLGPHGKPLPAARSRLVERLKA